MTIIDKYIVKELLISFFSVLIILLVIVTSTDVVHLLKWISEGVFPLAAFFPLIFNSIIEFTISLLPLGLLMAILLAFGRLYKDSEMTAMMSAGIGPWHWYRPLLLVVVPLSILLLLLQLFVLPIVNQQRADIKAEVRSGAEVDNLMIGQFNHTKKGNGVLFIESSPTNKKTIQNIFFQQQKDNKDHIDLAQSGHAFTDKEGRRYMIMQQGTHYTGNAGDVAFKIINYKSYGVFIDENKVQPDYSLKSKTVSQLIESNHLLDKAELQWRITVPIGMFIIALMALPLSYTNPRSGRYAKLALTLVIYLIYSNLLAVGKTWLIQQKVPVWIGTWWVHLVALILLYSLLRYYGFIQQKSKKGK